MLNAGVALYAADVAPTMADGIALAREALASGKALREAAPVRRDGDERRAPARWPRRRLAHAADGDRMSDTASSPVKRDEIAAARRASRPAVAARAMPKQLGGQRDFVGALRTQDRRAAAPR